MEIDMTKIALRAETDAAIAAFLANGGKINVCKPGRKTKDTMLTKFGCSAWAKTATIANNGRQYNQNRIDVAGSNTNKIAYS
jgi:hypothetical protein